MAKKQLFRMTEADVKQVMASVLKRVLKEGTTETSDLSTWEDYKEMIGADAMLDLIYNYLNSDQIRDLLDYIGSQLDADGYEH